MEYARLGKTDLLISRIGFGCEPIGGYDWGTVNDQDSIKAVRRALDLGVNFFDTADVYGLGRSEEVLSRALDDQRHRAIIATKFGINWNVNSEGGRARTFYDTSPKRVVEALEASLRRLRVDCIPLYQIHWPSPHTPIGETMEALERCREAGKIRYIGCCNFPTALVFKAQQSYRLESLQTRFSLLESDFEEEIFNCCEELGISMLVWGSLAQGLLTGKYGRGVQFEDSDRRSRLDKFKGEQFAENLELVEKIRNAGLRYGKTPSQVAIRWVLDNRTVACVITGIKVREQIEENVGALDWKLTEEDKKALAG